MRGPAIGEEPGGIADQVRRAETRCCERLLDRRDLRRDQRRAVAADGLKINVVVAGIDRGDHRRLAVFADNRRGIGHQGRDADRRLVGGKRDAARGRQPYAQAGETAGACGRGDAVERGEGDPGGVHDARNQRHQRFGVPALHRQRFMSDKPAFIGVQDTGGAGIECGVDRKNRHRKPDYRFGACPRLTRGFVPLRMENARVITSKPSHRSSTVLIAPPAVPAGKAMF